MARQRWRAAVAEPGRWWTYQRERFPIFGHGPLVLAFSLSAASYSSLLRGEGTLPSFWIGAAAFASALLFFFQLRIADEFKDFDDDRRFRPYRPVPRGLVSLRELGWVGVGTAVVQTGIALAVKPALLVILVAVWAYLALMSIEFGVPAWLKARPVAYMLSHMLIMPAIDFYVTAFDWLVHDAGVPYGLHWFLIVSFVNGIVIEIGRKVRAPQDEQEGVETYSALWGRARATWVWLAAVALCGAFAWLAAREIAFAWRASVVLALLMAAALGVALRFLASPTTQNAKAIELMAGVWTLGMYTTVGLLPLAWTA